MLMSIPYSDKYKNSTYIFTIDKAYTVVINIHIIPLGLKTAAEAAAFKIVIRHS